MQISRISVFDYIRHIFLFYIRFIVEVIFVFSLWIKFVDILFGGIIEQHGAHIFLFFK